MAKVTAKIDLERGCLTFNFQDGTVTVYELDDLSTPIIRRMALHGFKPKMVDSYAGDTGNAKTRVAALWQRLLDEEWNVRGESQPRVTILIRALILIDPELDESKLRESLAEMPDDERKSIETAPRVVAAIAKIKAIDATERLKKAEEAAEAEDEPIDVMALIG